MDPLLLQARKGEVREYRLEIGALIAVISLCALLRWVGFLGGPIEWPAERPELIDSGMIAWRHLEATRRAQAILGNQAVVIYIVKVVNQPWQKHFLIAYGGKSVQSFSSLYPIPAFLHQMRAALIRAGAVSATPR